MKNKNSETYSKFIAIVNEISQLKRIYNLLYWDQNTYMPKEAANDRASQCAIIAKLIHKKSTSLKLEKLFEKLENDKNLDENQLAIIKETKRDFRLLSYIPKKHVDKREKLVSLSKEAWIKARQENNFKIMVPWFEKIFDLKMQEAEYIGYKDCNYDAMIDHYEPGMTTKNLVDLLDRFKKKLIPTSAKIIEATKNSNLNDDFLLNHYDIKKQDDFAMMMVKDLGFNFNAGRMDETVHPFTTGRAKDVRIANRYNKNDLKYGLFACLHEAGHGLYDQGHLEKYYHTPLADTTSLGMHESQSRMYENLIGRSLAYWTYYYPKLQKVFPNFSKIDLMNWYKAINIVKPTLIRVNADELTYNLHILIRFEIEFGIFNNTIKVKDIKDIWNEKMHQYLGIVPSDDNSGCLQDVHWAIGLIGYFPTYLLGNLIASQLYDKILKSIPDLENDIKQAKFDRLLTWNQKNIYQYGRKYNIYDMLKKLTGSFIDEDCFLNYIEQKYSFLF